ncbi:MAG: 30S ribosome-binding factor RbfA [Isosphaerales bacterium]
MPTHRSLRMAEAIREVVATAILFDVADPRVRSVTVLRVEVSSDLRHATVYVSIMGPESEQKRTLKGLNHATGFLQARVAARLQTRFTPVLSFKHDTSSQKSVELARLIDQAIASDQRPEAAPSESIAVAEVEPAADSSARGHPADGAVPESS